MVMKTLYLEKTEKDDSDVENGEISPVKDAKIAPERTASFMSCVVTMAMTAMGLGVLGFPASFAQMGYVLATALTLVSAVFTHISMSFLARACTRTGTYSFEELSEYYLGWWGVRFTNWALIFQLFCVVAAFIIIPVRSVTSIWYPKLEDAADSEETFTFRRLLGFAIVIFLSFLGSVRSLSKLSFISTIAFLLLSGAVILFVLEFASATEMRVTPRAFPLVGASALAGIGNTVLAYTCQFNLVTAHQEMKDRSRIHTLIYITVYGMCLPLYCFMGLTGMFIKDIGEGGNAFDALRSSKVGTAGKAMVALMGIAKSPLVFNALRDYVIREARLLPLLQSVSMDNWIHRVVVSIGGAHLAYFFTWVFTDIGPPVGISGSLFMAPVNYILPALYMMKDVNLFGTDDKTLNRSSFCWNPNFTMRSKLLYALAVGLALFGWFCAISGIVGVGYSFAKKE